MKNVIKYYYGLEVDNIIEKDNNYRIVIDSNNYLLCRCNRNDLLNILKYINKYDFHTIINTINGDITIFLNNYDYVLLKLCTPYKKITVDDLSSFNFNTNIRCDSVNKWISLWSSHIDYIEYQIRELSNKYPILAKYTYYYIGLTETAIELLKTINIDISEYIVHRKIKDNMTLVDLYNPVNLILDSKVRDIAEYYKDIFFKKDIDNVTYLKDLYESIKFFNISELKLFFVRMLYPTYFFDLYDEIVGFGLKEENIYEIVDKSNKYEEVLKELYQSIKKATLIENIEWLTQLH